MKTQSETSLKFTGIVSAISYLQYQTWIEPKIGKSGPSFYFWTDCDSGEENARIACKKKDMTSNLTEYEEMGFSGKKWEDGDIDIFHVMGSKKNGYTIACNGKLLTDDIPSPLS
tara:strand:+ start:872 stop:1213 length:342 start_codon:yes stop_codon:yes gene_type:complete